MRMMAISPPARAVLAELQAIGSSVTRAQIGGMIPVRGSKSVSIKETENGSVACASILLAPSVLRRMEKIISLLHQFCTQQIIRSWKLPATGQVST